MLLLLYCYLDTPTQHSLVTCPVKVELNTLTLLTTSLPFFGQKSWKFAGVVIKCHTLLYLTYRTITVLNLVCFYTPSAHYWFKALSIQFNWWLTVACVGGKKSLVTGPVWVVKLWRSKPFLQSHILTLKSTPEQAKIYNSVYWIPDRRFWASMVLLKQVKKQILIITDWFDILIYSRMYEH